MTADREQVRRDAHLGTQVAATDLETGENDVVTILAGQDNALCAALAAHEQAKL